VSYRGQSINLVFEEDEEDEEEDDDDEEDNLSCCGNRFWFPPIDADESPPCNPLLLPEDDEDPPSDCRFSSLLGLLQLEENKHLFRIRRLIEAFWNILAQFALPITVIRGISIGREQLYR
jgi:hypothetical protein